MAHPYASSQRMIKPIGGRSRPAVLRVLLETQFGLFFAGNGLSLIGSWMQRIACGWLVWEWTASAFWLGVLAAGDLLPVLVTGPFAGVAADRWDRLKQNRVAQLASAAVAMTLAALLFLECLDLVWLVVLVTKQGTLVAAIQPARLAMVQQMVAREDMGVAVALNSVSVNLARLIGPAVAGAMILKLDIYWLFVLNALVTLIFVWVLGRLQLLPRTSVPSSDGFWRQMLAGFDYVANNRAIMLVLLALLVGGAFVRSILELVPAVAALTFDNTAVGLAALTAASATGAVGAAVTVRRQKVASIPVGVLIWWGIGALSALLLTQADNTIVAILCAVTLGASITRCLVGTQTFVQLTTPDGLRGRTLSVHGLIARGSPALGALAIGAAADRYDLPSTVLVTSIVMLVLVLVMLGPTRRYASQAAEAD